jgi:hypothetical protein
MKCLNCGQLFETPYCGSCGQKASSGRITGREVREALQSELHLSRGWLRTIVELTRRPGGMIRDYLDGHRVVYIGPVRYSLTIMAMTIFLMFSVLPPMFAAPVDAGDAALQKALLDASQRFGQLLGVLHAPVFALLAWAIFFRSGLGYAEHLTASLYCTGHLTLGSSLFMPLDSVLKTGGLVSSSVFYGVGIIYLALILRNLVARSWWTAGFASVAILFGGAAICCAGMVPILVILALRSMA